MNEYSITFRMYGTLYVKAKTKREAIRKMTEQLGSPEAAPGYGNFIEFSDQYIPVGDGCELSPAATAAGWNPKHIELERCDA